MIVAPIAGLIAPRVGVRVLLGSGLTLQALGLTWLAVVAGASTPYTDLVPGFVLAGIGMGLTFAPSATAVLADMAPDDHATASSTNSTIREIGVALGVAVLVAVFRANGGALTPDGYNSGLRVAILTGATVVALGALSTIGLPRTTAGALATSQAPSPAN
jgi:Major Facilitator Superfamily.